LFSTRVCARIHFDGTKEEESIAYTAMTQCFLFCMSEGSQDFACLF
jgi:hypothetical protein